MRTYSYRTSRALQYIEDHLFEESLSVGSVEQNVSNGCTQLRTLFKHETGHTLRRWIEAARMRRATDLLSEPDITIAEIAFSVGYASHEVFCRAFRRVLGMSPTEYRRKCQAKTASENVKTIVAEPAILYAVRATIPFLRRSLHTSQDEVPDDILQSE